MKGFNFENRVTNLTLSFIGLKTYRLISVLIRSTPEYKHGEQNEFYREGKGREEKGREGKRREGKRREGK